jgi:hypothetical protein
VPETGSASLAKFHAGKLAERATAKLYTR